MSWTPEDLKSVRDLWVEFWPSLGKPKLFETYITELSRYSVTSVLSASRSIYAGQDDNRRPSLVTFKEALLRDPENDSHRSRLLGLLNRAREEGAQTFCPRHPSRRAKVSDRCLCHVDWGTVCLYSDMSDGELQHCTDHMTYDLPKDLREAGKIDWKCWAELCLRGHVPGMDAERIKAVVPFLGKRENNV